MTGWRLTSPMPAMMRALSSCFEATRIWRRTERANLEKNPSMRLSHEPCLGVKVEFGAPAWSRGEAGSGFSRDVRGMIIEDQLDRSVRRIGGINKPKELDELSTAVAIFDKGVDLAGEQINPSQQAERAMAFVFMVTRKGGVDARLGRQIRRRRCDGLDSRLLVTGDDRHRLIFCSNSASRFSR